MYWDRCRVQKLNGSTECCYQAIDYNENSIRSQIRKLSGSFDKEEGLYAEADVKESADNGNSVEYADIEAIENAVGVQQYVEIDDVVRNNSISSEESSEGMFFYRFVEKSTEPQIIVYQIFMFVVSCDTQKINVYSR